MGIRIYLDSTIPSYWLEQTGDPIIYARHLLTRKFWADELPGMEVFVSAVVLQELSEGDPERAATRLKLVEGFELLPITDDVTRAVKFYVEQYGMPARNQRDAFHLAIASVHRVDYLVTWNFSHLANARKRTHIEVLNGKLALPTPIICSPEELVSEDPSFGKAT
jgi:hypothetical protein